LLEVAAALAAELGTGAAHVMRRQLFETHGARVLLNNLQHGTWREILTPDFATLAHRAKELRVLIRALIHIDSYHFADDVAAHLVRDDEDNQQPGEEVLLSVVDGLEDDKLSGFALRLALTGHADIPRENEIDHLAEAEAVFAQPQPKKVKAKKATTKKTAPIKTKTAKKKTAKKLAA
jgi:ParB family transcriptional regulator, chromosome partitioning protein